MFYNDFEIRSALLSVTIRYTDVHCLRLLPVKVWRQMSSPTTGEARLKLTTADVELSLRPLPRIFGTFALALCREPCISVPIALGPFMSNCVFP